MLKILVAISGEFSSTYGGGQVYIRNIVNEFIRLGMDIVICSVRHEHKDTTRFIEKSYRERKLFEITYNGIDTNSKNIVSKLLRDIQPDIIHAHGEKILFIELCKELNIPCVITTHHGGIICPAGTLLDYKERICDKPVCDSNCLPCCCKAIPFWKTWYLLLKLISYNLRTIIGNRIKKLNKFIYFLTPVLSITPNISQKLNDIEMLKKADAIIAPSSAIADALKRNGIEENVKIIPHGIPDIKPFPLIKIESPIKFFYIGRINYVKGIHIMLEAFRNISKDKYELHIIGSGANKKEKKYEKKLKSKHRGLNIIWYGKKAHSEALRTIKDLHVMIHPVLCLEVFGLTIAESLAIGRPVIATKCGGSEMQINEGVNGWLVTPNKIKNLRDKIIQLIENHEVILQASIKCAGLPFKMHIDELSNLYSMTIRNSLFQK